MYGWFSARDCEYRNIILAEIIVISRVTGFGQYGCGNEPLEEAARLFAGRQSEIIDPADPFTFGLPMLLHSEYMRAGTLDETVTRCSCNPYELVSDGFGRGSVVLITAAARELPDSRLTVRMLRETLILAECFFNTSLLRLSEIPPDFLDGSHQNLMAAGLGVPQTYAAQAMYAAGNPAGAARLCERLDALPSVCQCARLSALILTALCREKLDGPGSGVPALRTALTEAQEDGVVLHFAESPDLLPLLNKLKRGGADENFLSRVRLQCKSYRAVAPAAPQEAPVSLSERELAVLRLTAQGKSRAEVAAAFRVQENTVKAQLSSAYKKLGARGKTEAVRLAKTYGLL